MAKRKYKVFQQPSFKRWRTFLWVVRTTIAALVLIMLFMAVDLFILPGMHSDGEKMRKLLKPDNYDVFETRYNREFYELRQQLAIENGVECEMCSKKLNTPSFEPPVNLMTKPDSSFYKKLVLVFDDGPHRLYTRPILDILDKYDVPAAFFIVGLEAENNLDLLDEIYQRGHEIGNHTFTHPRLSKVGIDRTLSELKATKRLVESATGVSTLLYRPPFSEQAKLTKIPAEGPSGPYYYNITESIDPRDYEAGITASTIFERVVKQSKHGNVILLHDGGGDRSATVEALPRIIEYFQERGYEFTTVAEFIGLERKDVMPPLQQDMDAIFMHANRMVFLGFYQFGHLIKVIFILAIILAISRYFFIAILAFIQNRKSKGEKLASGYSGKVSVIVPAYNEQLTVPKTVENLLRMDYQNLEIIVVDDGSPDNTFSILKEKFGNIDNVKLYTKTNGGKALALNYGIKRAEGEILVCIDADTILKTNAIDELLKYFNSEDVASVAGNVKVGNERNSFTYWQSIEYITSQNFDRRAFDLINAITVVPGAIGAFKKEALLAVGMFKDDTLAEDCELSMRLLKHGYRIRYNSQAIAVTESPETLKEFMKQRVRWMYGIMQSFWKHREMAFNPKYKSVGLVAYPNMILFQIILPFLAPLADIIFLIGIIMGNGGPLMVYFIMYLMIEALGAVIAFSFERENLSRLIWLVPQRLVYRQLLFYALIKAILKAIRGEIMSWGFLNRTGNVEKVNV